MERGAGSLHTESRSLVAGHPAAAGTQADKQSVDETPA